MGRSGFLGVRVYVCGVAGTRRDVLSDFEGWYRDEYARMVNSLTLVVGDRSLAADAVGEACAKALARWERVRRMERPGGWVYRVALNEARRRGRRAGRERELTMSVPAPVPPPTEPDVELWAAVARLPERTRVAVVLRYVADLTEPDIADALGVRRGTVATMLRRARERLAAELGQPAADHRAQEVTP